MATSAPTPAETSPSHFTHPAAVRGGRVQHAQHGRVVELEVAQGRPSAGSRRPTRRPATSAGARRRTARAPANMTSTTRSTGVPSHANGRQTSANTTASTMSVVSLPRLREVCTDPPYALPTVGIRRGRRNHPLVVRLRSRAGRAASGRAASPSRPSRAGRGRPCVPSELLDLRARAWRRPRAGGTRPCR